MTTRQKLARLRRHIGDVQKTCNILGDRLIDAGEDALGLELIANAMLHDNSKFRGIEWESLHPEASAEQLKAAIAAHNTKNPHHPEYWGGIDAMPEVYLAEMVCDWSARSGELGTSLLDFIDRVAAQKYGYAINDAIHQKLHRFSHLLLEQFKSLA